MSPVNALDDFNILGKDASNLVSPFPDLLLANDVISNPVSGIYLHGHKMGFDKYSLHSFRTYTVYTVSHLCFVLKPSTHGLGSMAHFCNNILIHLLNSLAKLFLHNIILTFQS